MPEVERERRIDVPSPHSKEAWEEMRREEVQLLQSEAAEFLRKANIALSENERALIEVADFGLDDIRNVGLEIVVYENNDRYCAKELILFPRQMCPQHRHPQVSQMNPVNRRLFDVVGAKYICMSKENPRSAPKPSFPRNTRNTCQFGARSF